MVFDFHHFICLYFVKSGVRLVDGSNDLEGRVEVLYNGSWGTVCDDRWDMQDANVVCRMLGHGPATSAPGSAFFGQGSGDIILDEMSCSGDELDISECGHAGYLNENCGHHEDAGVVCSAAGIEIYLIFPSHLRHTNLTDYLK